MLALKGKETTLPGWRDFERAVAATFYGRAVESKAIFDVLLPDPAHNGVYFGLSCKMRETLAVVARTGRATLEISNASGGFWDVLEAQGLGKAVYDQKPELPGKILIELVESWHASVDIHNGGFVDTSASSYLVLQWDKKSGFYQLFQFPLHLRDPRTLQWEVVSRRLVGRDETGVLWEWYGLSGGQLKYYPLIENALWVSERFQLEPIKEPVENELRKRVAVYFPQQWSRIVKELP
jgi:hypothetical protein